MKGKDPSFFKRHNAKTTHLKLKQLQNDSKQSANELQVSQKNSKAINNSAATNRGGGFDFNSSKNSRAYSSILLAEYLKETENGVTGLSSPATTTNLP